MPTDESTTEGTTEDETEEDDFDKERALKTIRDQRKVEKAQAKELAELRKHKETTDAAAIAKAEADKDLETKLAERDQELVLIRAERNDEKVKADFLRVATLRGYEDPELAYLAAKETGNLGDPKGEGVGDHDFDALEERYPKLASEAGEKRGFGSGDAGRKSRKSGTSIADQFNDSVRSKMN